MTKYTAADFANAQFAKHPDGRFAARLDDDAWPWICYGDEAYDDCDMSDAGWVPVSTKPTITERQVGKELDGETKDFEAGFHYALAVLEAEIIPDPEPTNTEKWAKFLRKVNPASVIIDDYARAIDEAGVTAPEGNA